MDVRVEPSWKTRLQPFFDSPVFQDLAAFVKAEYAAGPVYPPARWMFRALDLCPFEQVRVVILGQDPYHGPGQANGLCFSVGPEVDPPPSLVNIFEELRRDLGREPRADRSLESWARQGVLLLNAMLTVRAHQPASHQGRGWEQFTDAVLAALHRERAGLVYVLWGSYAQKKGAFLDPERNLVLKSPHPSPLSAYRGFFGSRPFSQANAYLVSKGGSPVEW